MSKNLGKNCQKVQKQGKTVKYIEKLSKLLKNMEKTVKGILKYSIISKCTKRKFTLER